MTWAKTIYILIIKVNKLFSFFSSHCFLKDIENMYSVCFLFLKCRVTFWCKLTDRSDHVSSVDWCSQSVLNQHLGWHPTVTRSTSLSTLDWQSVDRWPSVDRLWCISQHSMACLEKVLDFWPTVNRDVIRILIEYRSRVDRGYQFRPLISTSLLHRGGL